MQEHANELMTAVEFARKAGVTRRCVQRWAADGVGPRPVRPPGTRIVRYRRKDVDAWLDGRDVRSLEAS